MPLVPEFAGRIVSSLWRTFAFSSRICYGFADLLGSLSVFVRGLVVQPWHLPYTGCLLYLAALLPLPLFFRFVVLV
jgi:hypothetical protein